MKKTALIAALLFLLGCLSACMPSKNTASQTTPTVTTQLPQETTLPEGTTAPVVHPTQPSEVTLSTIALSSMATPIVSQDFSAEDGTVLLTYTRQDIFLIYPDAAVADAVYLAIANAMSYASGLEDTLLQAQQAYAENSKNWQPYHYSVLFDTTRIDQTVISVFGSVCATTAETSSIAVSASFSLIDGTQLTFGDIQANTYHYYNLLKLIDTQLKASYGENLFEDYQETLASQLRSKSCTNWFFTETGLSFYYLPMEIAPNSEGTIVVEVPYNALAGLLKDDYFPAEEYTTGGGMYAQLFADAQLFRYQQFAEILVDSEGVNFILGTDGAVSDIRIEYGSWNADGTLFTPTATVYSCDGISSETAIVVQCDMPDVMPVLRLSYTSEGQSYSHFISQSGKDGSIIFSD